MSRCDIFQCHGNRTEAVLSQFIRGTDHGGTKEEEGGEELLHNDNESVFLEKLLNEQMEYHDLK
jgi:hypothetical protein